ncbi:hypothetical protein D8674_026808 [Pyrus ussuriensis x Pyrus communis]|uniref:C-JID domain-containing protein n=1 Tax=Pyrus ussuriensis x Pyrus communis TaxID=2448454 RepID=A0A5N5IMN1_9ROSA|nr:hypothetical protein D8674_026808 [Pyrus ussuriensis x Pyrus communis]
MSYCFVGAKLWSKNQNLGNLKVIELSSFPHLTEVPDLSHSKKIAHIVLYGCDRLVGIPSYFKDLDKLRWLNLGECTSLEFLPELPVLCCLEASGCTSLKTVSSSRNSLTQAWDKSEWFRGRFNFVDCRNLDENARTNIMADTQLRIMRVATGLLEIKQHKEEEIVMEMTSSIPTSARTLVSTVCEGNEIPNWFCHQNEGSSITIKLPRTCTLALGEEANLNRSTFFYKLVTEACFEFTAKVTALFRLEVKKCGISLLYAQDVKTIKSGGTTGFIISILGQRRRRKHVSRKEAEEE